MQKGFAPILILIGILVIMAVAGGAYYFGKSQISKPQSQIETSQTPKPAVVPQPTPSDETTDWKTFTKLGYEIKYPPSSVITEFDLDSSMPDLLSSTSTEVKVEGRKAPVLFLVYVWKNMGVDFTDNSSSREEWCKRLEKELTGQLQCNYGESLNIVYVNGYGAYQAIQGRDSTLNKEIYIPHNNYVYELIIPIGDDAENKFPISDQILSTFKFTQ